MKRAAALLICWVLLTSAFSAWAGELSPDQRAEADDFFAALFSGAKAVGGAVERNRAKRILRSAASALHEQMAPGTMVLLLARKPILEHDAPEITEILAEQLKKAGIFRGNAQEQQP